MNTSQEADSTNFSYTINTSEKCWSLSYVNEYYFTSSYKSLYDLFIEIIDAQDGDLPEGWQDKI